MSRNAVLLTGSTGALGCWILRELLVGGIPVYALARASADGEARQRVREKLAAIGHFDLSSLQVLRGDILSAGLRLDSHRLPDDVGMVIHCAASTDFHESARSATCQTNIEGLTHVLNLAHGWRARLVHVSTAYVAGRRTGTVYHHELDEGQQFNNAYEMSKCRGEAMVRRWAAATGLPAIILRPSIVLGAWSDGRALRFNTIYDVMRTLDLLGSMVRQQELRVVADPGTTKNIIPVDHFARIAWQIIRRQRSGTHHIVHPHPIKLATLRDIFAEMFACRQIALVSPERFAQQRATAAERACHRALAIYRPYMAGPEPVFHTTETTGPTLDIHYFRRMLDYARSVDWGRPPRHDDSDQADHSCLVREYFDGFLAGRVGQRLLPDLYRLSSQFAIGLHETPRQHWAVDIREGILHSVSVGDAAVPCRFRLNTPTFLEIVAGKLTPQHAFFSDRIQIEGDIQTGLKLAAVFGHFFRKYPFLPAQEGKAA